MYSYPWFLWPFQWLKWSNGWLISQTLTLFASLNNLFQLIEARFWLLTRLGPWWSIIWYSQLLLGENVTCLLLELSLPGQEHLLVLQVMEACLAYQHFHDHIPAYTPLYSCKLPVFTPNVEYGLKPVLGSYMTHRKSIIVACGQTKLSKRLS